MATKNESGVTIGRVTSNDGTIIEYEKSGAGPPLVVVMGALGFKEFSFAKKYAAAMAEHFTVFSYDRRGRGGSTDTQPYAVQREIEDLARVIKATGGSAYVWGTSSGAALALQAAAGGVPMLKLVAYEPPYMLEGAKARPAPDFEHHLKTLVAADERSEAVAYFMRTVGVPSVAVAIMKLFPFWKGLKSVAHTLPYDAAVMAGFHLPTATFAKVNVPTLVATGTKSPQNLQDTSKEVARIIPNAEHRSLPKENHGVRPKTIAAVVAEFCLRATPSPNGAASPKTVTVSARTRSS